MLFTTTTQWVALAIALVAGWLFGLASHPGGRKWKDRYLAEREGHAATRKDYDGRIVETRKEHDARIAETNARHAEIERENERRASAAPLAATPVAPRVRDHATPARSTTSRGWFNWSNRAGTNG